MTIVRTTVPRTCPCGHRAGWKVAGRRVYLCHDHAMRVARGRGVTLDRTGEPVRTAPGRSPLFHGGPWVNAQKVTADPARGKWRTRA